MTGDPVPFVDNVEFFAVTVPSPRSVASVAQEFPDVETVTLSALIVPP